MFFFDGKIELYNMLYLFVIPIGVPILMYFIKRKLLWISPFIVFALGIALTLVFYPYFFSDLLTNSNEIGGGGYWLIIMLPTHCIITAVMTAMLYAVGRIVNHFKKRRKKA